MTTLTMSDFLKKIDDKREAIYQKLDPILAEIYRLKCAKHKRSLSPIEQKQFDWLMETRKELCDRLGVLR